MTQPPITAAPELALAFQATVEIGTGIEVGDVPAGRKRIVPITGERVEGRLNGVVLDGGADWQTIRSSGVTDVWARYVVRADDGSHVIITNAGLRRASPEVSAKLAAGELVDSSAYYFRAAPLFETGAPEHRWLTESTFVCVGERYPDKVVLKFFEVR